MRESGLAEESTEEGGRIEASVEDGLRKENESPNALLGEGGQRADREQPSGFSGTKWYQSVWFFTSNHGYSRWHSFEGRGWRYGGDHVLLHELIKKMDGFDSRLSAMESSSVSGGFRESGLHEGEEGGSQVKGDDRNTGQDRVTRQTKVEFPLFDGYRVNDWLFRSERFFELDGTPPELKVSIASVYLTGPAMEWHYTFVKNRKLSGPISWDEYVSGMLMRFSEGSLE